MNCAHGPTQLDSQQQMPGVDFDALERLIAMGATEVAYHANGGVASIKLGPAVSSKDEKSQPDDSKQPTRRVSATGGLVLRGPDNSSD